MKNPTSATLLKIIHLIKSGGLESHEDVVESCIKNDLQDINEWINLGIACAQHNKLSDAILIFKLLHINAPPNPQVLYNLGLAYSMQGNTHEALKAYDLALEINPTDIAASINKASALNEMGDYAQALRILEVIIDARGDIPEAFLNQGIALNHLARYEQAIFAYENAIKLRPNYLEAWSNKSVPHNSMGSYLQALDACRQAIQLNPLDVNARLNLGNTLFLLKDFPGALDAYNFVLDKNPQCAEAYLVKAKVLHALQQFNLAIENYDNALRLDDSQSWAIGQKLHAKLEICRWDFIGHDLHHIENLIEANQKAILPFPFLSLVDQPSLQKKCAEIYSKNEFPENSSLKRIQCQQKNDKIKIAYYSADLHTHPVSFLIAEIFELHDKNAFELIGISFAQVKDNVMRDRIVKAFDQFIEVESMNDIDVACLSRDLGVDIAIDLMGYTHNSRTGIFAHRAAPIQINYLGYPGTMGAEYMDYIMADKVIIPQDFQADYSEKAIYLPHSYQPNDSKKIISDRRFTRQEMGLPENGFVFCCFNNNHKILPEMFDVWMGILHSVENSVLWLFDSNSSASENLRAEAVKRGISEDRLIFAPKLPLSEHLARHRLADLFLDTLPYNAHTTASDALWSGLPILTCAGKSFASRVAASLLSAIDLPELITHTLDDYAAKAISLARNPEDLKAIKNKLARNRLTQPLFNSELMTKSIESAYKKVYERQVLGLAPESIEIIS